METNNKGKKEYYSMPIEEVLKDLNTTIEGLSDKEAEKRLKENGYNELKNKETKTIFELIWKEITDPMILILILAIILSFVLKEWIEGIVISVIIFINIIISVIQEKKAEASIEALKSMNSQAVRAYRQGEDSLISAKELVVRRCSYTRGWKHGTSRYKINRIF